MSPLLHRVSTRLKYQVPLLLVLGATVSALLWCAKWTGSDLSTLDRATYMTFVGAIASVLALFCSISMSWVLFISQQSRTERISTYDLLKSRIADAQNWLLDQPASEDRELCLSLVYELDKFGMSDLPQTDRGDQFRIYAAALGEALDEEGGRRRRFYQVSMRHFGYIETLLDRIGMISIRQIITKNFIDTLAKGFSLVAAAVFVLIGAAGWYGGDKQLAFVVAGAILGIGAAQLLLEFFVDVTRIYKEELDFLDGSETDENGE